MASPFRIRDRLSAVLLDLPREREAPIVENDPSAPAVPRDRPIRVLSWNVQFSASRALTYFYDGGRAVGVPPAMVASTMDGLRAQIRALDPDIVLLQEVDRRSRRTGYLDQVAALQADLRYPCCATSPYFRVRYVPAPAHERLGPMDMHLVTLSRFRIADARRIPLPLLVEPWIRQQFNLRRGLLEVDLPIEGGGLLRTTNVHLSAFSHGDGTLARQIRVVGQRIDVAEAAGHAWIVAGDFNALPVDDDPARLVDPWEYEAYSPMVALTERFRTPTTKEAPTYLHPSGAAPDRVLDWMFHADRLECSSYAVIDSRDLSDHRPLIATLKLA